MLDGVKIKALRESRGYTLRVLAAMVSDALGATVTASALSAVEMGDLDLSVERTAALAAALGVEIGEVLLPFEPAGSGGK